VSGAVCQEKRNVSIPMVFTLYQEYVASRGEKEKKNSNNRRKKVAMTAVRLNIQMLHLNIRSIE
jgi:hypothetical protein